MRDILAKWFFPDLVNDNTRLYQQLDINQSTINTLKIEKEDLIKCIEKFNRLRKSGRDILSIQQTKHDEWVITYQNTSKGIRNLNGQDTVYDFYIQNIFSDEPVLRMHLEYVP